MELEENTWIPEGITPNAPHRQGERLTQDEHETRLRLYMMLGADPLVAAADNTTPEAITMWRRNHKLPNRGPGKGKRIQVPPGAVLPLTAVQRRKLVEEAEAQAERERKERVRLAAHAFAASRGFSLTLRAAANPLRPYEASTPMQRVLHAASQDSWGRRA